MFVGFVVNLVYRNILIFMFGGLKWYFFIFIICWDWGESKIYFDVEIFLRKEKEILREKFFVLV